MAKWTWRPRLSNGRPELSGIWISDRTPAGEESPGGVENLTTSRHMENMGVDMPGGPNALLRLGCKRDSLKADDLITVEGSLARDGGKLANAKTILRVATGKRMLSGSSGP